MSRSQGQIMKYDEMKLKNTIKKCLESKIYDKELSEYVFKDGITILREKKVKRL